jgi:hypothetical protein
MTRQRRHNEADFFKNGCPRLGPTMFYGYGTERKIADKLNNSFFFHVTSHPPTISALILYLCLSV